MNRKRSSFNSICDIKRRKLVSSSEEDINHNVTDTPSALAYLSSLFPVEKFQSQPPPIVMRHQIYALVKCRTEVDKCLNNMRKNGEIRLFKLGPNDDEVAVLYQKDYKQYVEKCCNNNSTVGNFMNVVSQCPDISFSKNVLMNTYGMKEESISELIQQGLMTSRDVGCYWLSIPKVGEFVKTLLYGRRMTLNFIKRTKYKEILWPELQKRKLPRKARLGILYHIYDVIGSDSVTCIDTATGTILRLQPEFVSGK